MMTQETYVNINDLHKQGWTIQEIAEETGWHRTTVSQRLKEGPPPAARPTEATVMTDKWRESIDTMLEAHPRLLAISVHNKLNAAGFDGSYPTVVRAVRDNRGPRFKAANAVSVPIHTAPGDEALCGVPHRASYVATAIMRRRAQTGPFCESAAWPGAAYSQAFKEGEQRVGWVVAAWACVGWSGLGEGFLFEAEVGVQVDAVGCSDVFVAEPEGDGRGVHAVAKQVHGAAVAQGVGRHVFGDERRAGKRCGGDVALDETPHRVATELRASGSGKQGVVGCSVTLGEPGAEHAACFAPQWSDPFLASFAVTADVGAGAELDCCAGEPGDLTDPKTGLDREQHQGVIASTDPSGKVWCSEKCFGLVFGEVGDQCLARPFRRDGEDSLDQVGVLGVSIGGEVEQGTDGGESGVAGSHADTAFVLEVVEERSDHGCVEVFDGQMVGCAPGAGMNEAQQQTKRVSVGGDGVLAGLALVDQSLGEERFEQWCERAHRGASAVASSRSAMIPSSSGTPDKYQ